LIRSFVSVNREHRETLQLQHLPEERHQLFLVTHRSHGQEEAKSRW